MAILIMMGITFFMTFSNALGTIEVPILQGCFCGCEKKYAFLGF